MSSDEASPPAELVSLAYEVVGGVRIVRRRLEASEGRLCLCVTRGTCILVALQVLPQLESFRDYLFKVWVHTRSSVILDQHSIPVGVELCSGFLHVVVRQELRVFGEVMLRVGMDVEPVARAEPTSWVSRLHKTLLPESGSGASIDGFVDPSTFG